MSDHNIIQYSEAVSYNYSRQYGIIDLNALLLSCRVTYATKQPGVAGLVLEYLDPAEGWCTTATAASVKNLRGRPTLLVQQVVIQERDGRPHHSTPNSLLFQAALVTGLTCILIGAMLSLENCKAKD